MAPAAWLAVVDGAKVKVIMLLRVVDRMEEYISMILLKLALILIRYILGAYPS